MRTKEAVQRILAIDPTVRGFAYVLLESGTELLDWATIHVESPKNGNTLLRVSRLIDRCRPTVVVFENCEGPGSRRCKRVSTLLDQMMRLATTKRVLVRRFSRQQIRDAFVESGEIKHAIALAIAKQFPELQRCLPRERRLWMSEDERMNVFDAVSLALTFIRTTHA